LQVIEAFVHLGLVGQEHVGISSASEWAVRLDISLILHASGGNCGIIAATHLLILFYKKLNFCIRHQAVFKNNGRPHRITHRNAF
jgi:hypothetical protein